jgi:hypothetical protein
VSEAVGFAVRPSYRAVYMYYAPSARVHPHVDHADYEIICHLTLAHVPPADGSRRAALVVYRLDRPPARVELAEGEAMVLRGRGAFTPASRSREESIGRPSRSASSRIPSASATAAADPGATAAVPEPIDKEVGMAEKTEETEERDEREQAEDLPVDTDEADKVKGGIYCDQPRAPLGPCDRAGS